MPLTSVLSRSGQWFLRSGIQEPAGGVARYYRTDIERNLPVSTEITGYALSTLLWLHSATGHSEYLDRGLAAARFLARSAWDGQAMPFEVDPGPNGRLSYFFDCGIIIRGLLAAWRTSSVQEFLDVATALGRIMAADFATNNGDYHPILKLPEKRPLERDALRWSQAPGCYQLKSEMAWWDLFEATSDTRFREPYEHALEAALRSYGTFLPGHPDRLKVVDRLHAFVYFLEGLLPRAQEKRCSAALCHGIQRVSQLLEENAPEFERSDVYAQLLRIRIYADWAGAAPLDVTAAECEAAALAGFQASASDPHIDGGFYFGRRRGAWLPYVNPVSTAFAVQALAFWDQHRNGSPAAHPRLLI